MMIRCGTKIKSEGRKIKEKLHCSAIFGGRGVQVGYLEKQGMYQHRARSRKRQIKVSQCRHLSCEMEAFALLILYYLEL